jgi:hypothetical protein
MQSNGRSFKDGQLTVRPTRHPYLSLLLTYYVYLLQVTAYIQKCILRQGARSLRSQRTFLCYFASEMMLVRCFSGFARYYFSHLRFG